MAGRNFTSKDFKAMAKPEKAAKVSGIDLSAMSIEEAIESLNKKYGLNTVIMASDAKTLLRTISTGSYALDFALGGGLPETRLIEINGPFSSFKSTISLRTARSFQKKYPGDKGLVIYIDLEKTFDAKYAASLGVNLARVLLVNPDSGEQAVNLMDDLMQLPIAIFIIVDSVAALVPTAEIVSDFEQQHMGLQARLVNKMMRIATARIKRDLYNEDSPTCTIVFLNQLRKTMIAYGNPETTPGGEGKNFAYSTIIRLSSTKSNHIEKEETRNGVKHKVKYGQVVTFKVSKNKCGGPQHEEGEFTYFYKDCDEGKARTFNNVDALFHYGAFNDVITFDATDGYSYRGISSKKESLFKQKLAADSHACRMLYREILQVVMNNEAKSVSDAKAPKKLLFKK